VKVAIAAIEKEGEAGKADLAEGTVKVNTAAIAKVVVAERAVIVVAGKAEVVEAVKAAMAETGKETAEEIVKAGTAEAVDTEASPEGAGASTGTAQKNIPVMTSGGQGKNREASLGQGLTAPNS